MPILRGEVYFIDLDPVVGREQGGRRPVVVVSNDQLNRQPLTVLVVPGTTARRFMFSPWNITVPAGQGGLAFDTLFMAFQTRAADHSRFRDPPCGRLHPSHIVALERALVAAFYLFPPASASALKPAGGPP